MYYFNECDRAWTLIMFRVG